MARSRRRNIKRRESTGSSKPLLVPEKIAPLVLIVRGERVLLDSDIARLYGTETKAINQAVKRNTDRFPEDFMFQLNEREWEALRSQFVTANAGHHAARSPGAAAKRRHCPFAFTEQGVAMLSSVLRSPRAIAVNLAIMRTFLQLRRLMDSNRELARKIESLEKKYDQQFLVVFEAIKKLIAETKTSRGPGREIGFHARD